MLTPNHRMGDNIRYVLYRLLLVYYVRVMDNVLSLMVPHLITYACCIANILKQDIYFPSEYTYLNFTQRHCSTSYKLDLVICSNYLCHSAILMLTSILLCCVHQDYGTSYHCNNLSKYEVILTCRCSFHVNINTIPSTL